MSSSNYRKVDIELYKYKNDYYQLFSSADPEGGTGGPDPSLKNHKLYGFL